MTKITNTETTQYTGENKKIISHRDHRDHKVKKIIRYFFPVSLHVSRF